MNLVAATLKEKLVVADSNPYHTSLYSLWQIIYIKFVVHITTAGTLTRKWCSLWGVISVKISIRILRGYTFEKEGVYF